MAAHALPRPPAELLELTGTVLGVFGAQKPGSAADPARALPPALLPALLDLYLLGLLPLRAEDILERRLESDAEARAVLLARSDRLAAGQPGLAWHDLEALLALRPWQQVLAPVLVAALLTRLRPSRRPAPGRVKRSAQEKALPIVDSRGETVGQAQLHLPRAVCDESGRCRISLLLPDLPEPWRGEAAVGRVALRARIGETWIDVPLSLTPYRTPGPYATVAGAVLHFHGDQREYGLNWERCCVALLE